MPSAALRLSGAIEISAQPGVGQLMLTRPKQVALLAILACSRERFMRRDALFALLWAELDQERARAALRKTVFAIRRDLGADIVVNRGVEEIGLGADAENDVGRFRALLQAGDIEGALSQYQGELLPAFHLSGAPEFERWLDGERSRFATEARKALQAGFERARQVGDASAALRMADHALRHHPDDESLLRESMSALAASGSAAEALRAFERYRARLLAELDAEPHAETEGLAQTIREALEPAQAAATAVGSAPAAAVSQPDDGGNAPAADGLPVARAAGDAPAGKTLQRSTESRRFPPAPVAGRPGRTSGAYILRRIGAGVGLLLLAISGIAAFNAFSTRKFAAVESGLATHAVAGMASYLPQDSSNAAALADMLATSLARIPGLPMMSTLRMYEASGGDASPAALASAARHVGAAQVFEGALHGEADGGVRLELRRVDLESGTVLDTYRVQASTQLEAVNRATLQVANSLGLPSPASSFASVSTASTRAYEHYERGLRAWYGGNENAARELFRSAVAEDSTFAMATWMLATTLAWQPEWIETYDRAVRLAERATERERLMINASYLAGMEAPDRREAAELLKDRYPQEPMGHQLTGAALMAAGQPLAALPHLQRVLELDTLGLLEIAPGCIACEAYWHIGAAYFGADSADAGLRTWEAWSRAAPASAAPWSWIAFAHEARGRYEEAEHALRRMQLLDPEHDFFEVRLAGLQIHANRLSEADSLLQSLAPDAALNQAGSVYLNLTVLRMNEGRFREALEYADAFRATAATGREMLHAYLRGIVLLNAGDGRAAAALFDSIAVAHPDRYTLQSRRGREMAMNRTHAADAAALLGDIHRLTALEDSVRQWGAMSGYERDRIMHHHVRGLRLRAEGRLEEATTEFRKAQFGLRSAGYGRTNLELGRTLLMLDRPEEAIEALRLNILANIGADQLWSSRTEARELLGIAHEAAGNADSARVHFSATVQAWHKADPELRARREAVARRIR